MYKVNKHVYIYHLEQNICEAPCPSGHSITPTNMCSSAVTSVTCKQLCVPWTCYSTDMPHTTEQCCRNQAGTVQFIKVRKNTLKFK